MELEATQTVGNVKATYRKPRKTYDYKTAADGHSQVNDATIEGYTKMVKPRIDWRGICNHVGIDNIPFTESNPGVTVKLI